MSTNVGEEGLDIAECDLVVFYDVVASEIRLIQRKGRTARHREGKVAILYSKGTRDEIYLKIALSKLKRMNVNLRNPQQLRESYYIKDSKKEKLSIPDDELETKKIISFERTHPKKIIKKQYQSRLQTFIDAKQEKIISPIKISKFIPMKFGLRKKFQNDEVSFDIVESDLHIVVHNKVLIQIYNPKGIDFNELLAEINDFKQISSLVIIIFDFIDFKEEIEGEKRILKRNIQEFAKEHNFQAISIDNEEELYFIIKNIVENPHREE